MRLPATTLNLKIHEITVHYFSHLVKKFDGQRFFFEDGRK